MARQEQLQVLVVEENPLTRFGISSVINLHPLLRVCDEAADARSARTLYHERRPHIVVLDVVLPMGDGLDLVKEFALAKENCRLVVVSQLHDPATVKRAFRAGVQGYISKKDEAAQLFCAMEAVRNGETFVSKIVQTAIRDDITHTRRGSFFKLLADLSDRELYVLRRMGNMHGTSAIARDLGISVKTVETHQTRIKQKLKLSNIKQLHSAAEAWINPSKK